MITWCAYCQGYMGEAAPLKVFTLTHGICNACRSAGVVNDPSLVTAARIIAKFYAEIAESALSGRQISIDQLLKRALELGISNKDLLMGIVQPVLYQVGEAFAQGKLRIATEHGFTIFCEAILHHLYQERFFDSLNSFCKPQERLLVCANDNYHTLGVKFLEFFLREEGLETFALYPGLPAKEVADLIRLYSPRILGISLAMSTQMQFLAEIDTVLGEMEEGLRPEKIIIGGCVFREFPKLSFPDHFQIAPFDYANLIEAFR